MIHLASRSPRRAELLRQIGLDFAVLEVDVKEHRGPDESPEAYVGRVARDKARAGFQALHGESRAIVIGADTEVVLDGDVFGKPDSDAAAADMLRRLSGRCHRVLSGVCCVTRQSIESVLCESIVTFMDLTEADIAAYVASGESRGKAGAYAIQGCAAVFVRHLAGSYSGVMGLPLFETAQLLRRLAEPR